MGETRDINKLYQLWLKNAVDDIDLKKELLSMDEKEKEDAFYRDLEFGTGGLRGVIGAGTNRMNIYTVSKATQGFANYILKHFKEGKRSVAISRDSRIKGELFLNTAASIFAANGIKVYIYPYISPVPTLSFATRYLKCSAGVMITASHNPSKYNGYKVYGKDGCQLANDDADEVLSYIESLDIFKDIKKMPFDLGFKKGLIKYIEPEVLTAFIQEVKNQSLLGKSRIDKDVSIVYSPLNGTGLVPVKRCLNEMGFTNITIVKEQEFPNGYFPTCSYPNPEIKEAMALGMEYAKKCDADLLVATDPDCDRVGIAVKNSEGEFVLFSGNETGCLLLDYICSRRRALKIMPEDPIMVKTIVSTPLAKRIADSYKVKTIDVLTGFKYIGEQIRLLEKRKKQNNYIFGFEESYGYLSGTYVRDKDAVNATELIVEMFAYYKSKGISLIDKLNELYQKFGYTLNTLYSFEFEGKEGFSKMQSIMKTLREDISSFGDMEIKEKIDYMKKVNNLPKADVLKFVLSDDEYFIARPSGTEPKLKAYISVSAKNKEEAKIKEEKIHSLLTELFK
ncbi:MAG: phospho-sugar mutase [Candidatus Enterosoma sp.]|nr:phospho-sugar mutase [Candidatus Enterosoma sp.]MDY5650335.1 phospho-sugar mutase [Candidatus Enterosoma sp.]